MKLVLSVALVVVVALAVPGRAQDAAPPAGSVPSETCKIVVLNLVGRGLEGKAEEDLPAILTETLANEVEAVSTCDVVSQQDILAMLDFEKQKAVCTDGSDSCLAEVGQALGAERVVAGTVSKLGGELILAARLMNVRKGNVEKRAELPIGGSASNLRVGAKNVGRRLFDAAELPMEAGGAAPATGGSPGLFWTGAVVGGVGAVATVGGGVLAGVAEGQLGDATSTNKDEAQTNGLIGVGVAAVGALVAVVGGVLVIVGME